MLPAAAIVIAGGRQMNIDHLRVGNYQKNKKDNGQKDSSDPLRG
jgi:hypothetical protein